MTNFPNYIKWTGKKEKASEHSILYNTRSNTSKNFSTLKMEARDLFETLVTYQNTRCHIPQEHKCITLVFTQMKI